MLHLLHVTLQDLPAALLVGPVPQSLAVEPAGPQQRGVENFRPVGGRQNDEPRTRVEAVELHQQLIERLLLFVVAPGIALQLPFFKMGALSDRLVSSTPE